MAERLTLKWGTLKGWDNLGDKSQELVKQYLDLGVKYSAMAQQDTPEQKRIICELIDTINGEIWNDWNDTAMSKDAAKHYVQTYRA